MLRRIAQIDVENDDVVAAGQREAELERLTDAEIGRVMRNTQRRVALCELLRDHSALVAAAIVDDDDLEAKAILQTLQVREQVFDVLAKDAGLVVDRQDDRHQRPRVAGSRPFSHCRLGTQVRRHRHFPADPARYADPAGSGAGPRLRLKYADSDCGRDPA